MSRTARWAVALVVVFILANGLTVALRTESKSQRTADWSTYRLGGQGTGALYGMFQRLGLPAARLETPLTEIPRDCAQMWMLYPTQPPTREELAALRSWVRDGGQLVCSWDFLVFASMFAREMTQREKGSSSFPELSEAQPTPPAIGAASLATLAVGKGAGAWASPGLREGLFEEVRLLHFPEGRGLARSAGWQPLVEADGQVLVAARPAGKGWILFIADPYLLSNSGLRQADNAVFAANVAALAPGRVYFDEEHHGFTSKPRNIVALIRQSRGGPAAAVTALGLGFILLAVAWRFGRAQEPPTLPRRSSLEYVHSFADLYRRAGCRGMGLRILYEGVRRRLAGSAGGGDLTHAQLARLSTRRVALSENEVQAALDQARERLDQGCATDAEALRAARGLVRLVSRPGGRRPARRG